MFGFFKNSGAKYRDLDPEEFVSLSKEKDFKILDVRSPGELSEGKISGYVQINFFDSDFKQKVEKLDKTKSYLIYCRGGNRSKKACKLMASMGFENLYNLKGGIQTWNNSSAAL